MKKTVEWGPQKFILFSQSCQDNKISENRKDWSRSTHWRNENCIHKYSLSKILKEWRQ